MTAQGGASKPLVVIANPSADVYGSDLQVLESVTGLTRGGFDVLFTSPDDGPLLPMVRERGARVEYLKYPVLRRSQGSALGMASLAGRGGRSVLTLAAFLNKVRPSVVYVNTVTLPWWLLAARLARVPVTCHVHEAERQDRVAIRRALYGPLVLANQVIVNSQVTQETVVEAASLVRRRCVRVYNGVRQPDRLPTPISGVSEPITLALVGRLSPRKGVDVALEALSLVRDAGVDARLEVCGTAFEGYEWFETALRDRAGREDLAGAVTFSGYVDPVWPAISRAQIVLATSHGESLGNAVIEAQLGGRPVVASRVSGHTETIDHGHSGLLVEPRDARALAESILHLVAHPDEAARLGRDGQRSARNSFSVERYRHEVVEAVRALQASP